MSLIGQSGVAEVTNRFWTLRGRAPSQDELDRIAPMYSSRGWDVIDATIMASNPMSGGYPGAYQPVPVVPWSSYPAPGPASLSWGGIGDFFGKVGDAIGVFTGGGGGSPPMPTFPGGAPPTGMIPPPTFPGSGGPPSLPGPTTTMGMGGAIGGAIGAAAGAIARSGVVRTIARNIVPGVVAGVAGEWVFDKLRGWFFRKHRHPRMNVLNPRALSRANRRVVGFAHISRKVLKQLGYKVERHRHVKGKARSFGRKK